MNLTIKNLSDELKNKNIRLSHQRLKVLEYLIQNRCHPTADQIYNALHKDVPTLSKTTVYNTLNALVKANIVRPVNIENTETRYDIHTFDHGHFKCESCGDVVDFSVNPDALRANELNDYEIIDKNVYFKGICPKCLQI